MSRNDALRRPLAEFRQRYGVPAAGAAVVTRSGDLSAAVVGARRRGSEPVTVDDQWHIGSCGKALTAALYGRLLERGDAEWGVPVRDCFPDLADQIDPGWATPTIDELLTCRAGVRPNLSRTEMRAAWDDQSPMPQQRSRAVVSALSGPPRRHGRFRYSNLGYIVVGAAIERITGTTFETALRTELLEPLSIVSAGFGPPPLIWGHRPRVRAGSLMLGTGSPAAPTDPLSDNPPVATPAGRLHINLDDWATAQRIFLEAGRPLLSSDTVAHLFAVPGGGTMAMGWAPAAGLPGASYGMQGSNTMWAATALIDADRERTAMVVTNDGRTRVLRGSARLAAKILEG